MSTYQNTLQFSSEWTYPINAVWLCHSQSNGGSDNYYNGNINLQPDGPDEPTGGVTINSATSVRDHWNVSFMDEFNDLYCSVNQVYANIPNKSGTNDIEIAFSVGAGNAAQFTITWQDGSQAGPYPMYFYGSPDEVLAIEARVKKTAKAKV